MSQFVHLHTHSHYSLLNALPKIPDLVKAAKDDGQTALALTDNGGLYGAIEFYQECKKQEIKPILGLDVYVAPRTRHDKDGKIDRGSTRLVLLAQNEKGWKNLLKLSSLSYLEGFYYKPRVDKELLAAYSEGLIAIIPSFSGEIVQILKTNDTVRAKETLEFYKKTYGENLYFEITHHPEIDMHEEHMEHIMSFAQETSVPIVAAHDVYYLKPTDRSARETLVSIGGGKTSLGGFDESEEDFSFITQKQAVKLFKKNPETLENTVKIADSCNLEIVLGQEAWKFPDLKTESGKSPDDELRDKAYAGVSWRGMELTEDLKKRIDYELEVIKTKGYSKYFLVVADILAHAKKTKILSNTRGSAAGSLVSYLVGITLVDPIELGLPFERFLNPGRPSAPDIDMDFADARRDELITYVREKYGKDNVAQIGTFGTMAARGAVRDVARALGFPYSTGDRIAKLIPMGAQGFPMTIDRAMDEVPELKEIYKKERDVHDILDMAKKIEGCARHIGVHAAGVVISPRPLTEDAAIQWDPKGEGKLITQFDMHSVGEDGVGLLKFDFLGLKNLTIMGNTLELIHKLKGVELDIDTIPLDDTKTYDMLARGETAATFQLNGDGMTRFLKELKPTNIFDINAMVALYRPGPMAFIPDYIERKHNPERVRYIDNRFKDILEQTFGILIYQDDIMLIAVHFAGYSWGDADKFRKAMGKKIPEVMMAQKEKFSKGCQEVGGLTEKQTQELWDSIETFAAYGFNKAHAASYGRIAYLTSYLKANYPVLYMTAVLTAESGDTERVAEMVAECKRMGIDVMPPAINESFSDFTVVKDEKGEDHIRFGLTTIKNFGEGISEAIIAERKRGGKFASLTDFLERVQDRNLNKKSLESLIKSGAMDEFGERGEMLENLDLLLAHNKEMQKNAGQDSLFGSLPGGNTLNLKPSEQASMEDKLSWEKELLGLYISGHPLDRIKDKLENGKVQLADLKKEGEEEQEVVVGGIIEDMREIYTKKGDKMAFIKLRDLTDTIECVAFPKTLEEYKTVLVPESVVAFKGHVSIRNDEKTLKIDKVKKL
ncbi:MAG: DNA polymerase III subunit alpha [Candidatus Zambryskibacteria bacterium CG10_big_fil_rev_8_21_14_0_10_42_12]|uniref:DNA polymerase III subunit alpha n=1 Tax=Candidatus Zambryskibacteria bacterium CG10_big_fil_rev_8_21_14_0_10_42_12 TaxID=1975115 RepID=A0A2H0QWU8_9BACT|nr:MAG: DNA polymerase III subunit alpha [Candidatus Zambryskibacteria bacterium CG10_big_fil_rev_8_21_14_0_10_42_12]